jgi:hypothetical protein
MQPQRSAGLRAAVACGVDRDDAEAESGRRAAARAMPPSRSSVIETVERRSYARRGRARHRPDSNREPGAHAVVARGVTKLRRGAARPRRRQGERKRLRDVLRAQSARSGKPLDGRRRQPRQPIGARGVRRQLSQDPLLGRGRSTPVADAEAGRHPHEQRADVERAELGAKELRVLRRPVEQLRDRAEIRCRSDDGDLDPEPFGVGVVEGVLSLAGSPSAAAEPASRSAGRTTMATARPIIRFTR